MQRLIERIGWGYEHGMPHSTDELPDDVADADRRNGEPGALRNGDDALTDDGAGQLIDPDEDIDVTDSTESTGEPIHHHEGGDIGDGAD